MQHMNLFDYMPHILCVAVLNPERSLSKVGQNQAHRLCVKFTGPSSAVLFRLDSFA